MQPQIPAQTKQSNVSIMSHPSPQPGLSLYLPRLDGLRGIAIALVLVHSLTLLGQVDSVASRLVHSFFAFGWAGVQLFFVLSGFLITGILLDTRHRPHYFKNFYIRRALRIFPLYYATLIVAFIILPGIGHMPDVYQSDAAHQARLWLYLTNWHTDVGIGFSHYWSLALEEQFYLIWPLVIYFASPRSLLKISLIVLIAGMMVRYWMRNNGFPEEAVYIATPCRVDALTTGSAAAVLMRMPEVYNWIKARTPLLKFIAVALGVLAITLTGSYGSSLKGQVFGYGVLALFFALTVLIAATLDREQVSAPRPSGVLSWKPLRILGKYSYGMYVFQRQIHVFIGIPLIKQYASTSLAINIIYVIAASLLTLGLAVISYHLFELPFLRIKNKFVN